MFDFIWDIGNYSQRVVGRYDSDDGDKMVSTARVNDGRKPYETAFQHPEYNDGNMVIVEAYDTKEQAAEGHDKWLKVMTEGPLPDVLVDCQNSEVSSLLNSADMRFARRLPPHGV